MINAYSIFTSEVDDIDVAISDIKQQLAEINLRKNSVGIIVCHYDYLHTGTVEAISNIVPFSLVGFTTFFQKTDDTQGLFELTITVLTSDDAEFVLTEDHSHDSNLPTQTLIEKSYLDACKSHKDKPACIFNFITVNRPISGDEYVNILDNISGGVPCFGGIATSDNDGGQNMYVISDGEYFSYGYSMLLIFGDVKPKFHFVNYDEGGFIDMPGTITKVEGQTINEVNHRPVSDFLIRRGIDLSEDKVDGLLTIPFLFRKDIHSPYIARTAYGIDDNGGLKLFGEALENTLFRVGTAGPDDIITSSEKLMREAVSMAPNAGVFFMFSCIGRYISLGMKQGSEFENVENILPKDSPYLATYVSGEICPIINDETYLNEFHNSSLIVCSLE